MTGRRLSWKWLLLLAAALATPTWWALAQDGAPAGQEVRWRVDYNAARKEAHDKNLPLLLDFWTKPCLYCDYLDQRTFRSAKVAAVMNDKFVPLKVDARMEPKLVADLNINAYPTIVLASADGKILDVIVGFKEAEPFHDHLQRVLASITPRTPSPVPTPSGPPDWMLRDYQVAVKAHAAGDYPRSVATLKTILEDGQGRPVQINALKLLKDIEALATDRIQKARELQAKGQNKEVVAVLAETIRLYAGTAAVNEALTMLTKAASTSTTPQVVSPPHVVGTAPAPDPSEPPRNKRSRELLAQAKEFHKAREFHLCLDRCEVLINMYGDLAEGTQAVALRSEIHASLEPLQQSANTLGDRLASSYLGLADLHLAKGQIQQAEFYLQRVVIAFPGSRHAESAQIRLGQLQGTPARRVEIPVAGP